MEAVGQFNEDAFFYSLTHQQKRPCFVEQNGKIKQYIAENEEVKIDFIDINSFYHPESEFNIWIQFNAEKPFEVENNWLFILRCLRYQMTLTSIC
jgi:hypothetical protein